WRVTKGADVLVTGDGAADGRAVRGEDRGVVPDDLRQRPDVVAVLVGNANRVDVGQRHVSLAQGRRERPDADTAVDQDRLFRRRDDEGVPGAAAAETLDAGAVVGGVGRPGCCGHGCGQFSRYDAEWRVTVRYPCL